MEWQSLFPKGGVKHLTAPNLDHNPILLDTHLDIQEGVKPFRFKAMWVKDSSSTAVVQGAWASPVVGSQSVKLMKGCQKARKDFIKWNRSMFGFVKSRIKEIENKLKLVQDLDPTQENLAMEAALHLELNEWLEREELKWRQKSKELWLKDGDRNSKFFHLSTMIRRRRNFISEIKLLNN